MYLSQIDDDENDDDDKHTHKHINKRIYFKVIIRY